MPNDKAVVVESRVAYSGRIFDVVQVRITPPHDEAREALVEVVQHAPSVGIIAMPGPDSVLLVRQYRHAAGTSLWELPAGSVDAGEEPIDAARRECHEELGLVAGRAERLATLFPLPGYCSEEMTFFLVTNLRQPAAGDPFAHQDEDEHIEAREFTVADVRRMLDRGEIRDLKAAAALALIGR